METVFGSRFEKRDLAFLAGAAFAYFGIVGTGFVILGLAATALGWQPESQWALQIYAPLLLCGVAALVLAAMFRVVLRNGGLTLDQAKRFWWASCGVGFVMWWNLWILLMPIRFPGDISGDAALAELSIGFLAAGTILMHYSKPASRSDEHRDARPAHRNSH